MVTLESILEEIDELSRRIIALCIKNDKKVATAESCTGGMLSQSLTAVSGSSSAIELGICSYSNRIKTQVLGVSEKTLEEKSEYSIECAMEMAKGVREMSGADFAVSVTGVAGPNGGTKQHPVGEIYIGFCSENGCSADRYIFMSPIPTRARSFIRAMATKRALLKLLEMLQKIK